MTRYGRQAPPGQAAKDLLPGFAAMVRRLTPTGNIVSFPSPAIERSLVARLLSCVCILLDVLLSH